MKPGLVSVVIPTYNRAQLLRRAVASALGQTYRPIEVIVVDDGSTDETGSMLAADYPAVRYLRQARGGVVAARNAGLAAAEGEFIALLDSDDAWVPWKIELQVAVLHRRPSVLLSWTDAVGIDQHGRIQTPRFLRRYLTSYRHFQERDIFQEVASVSDFLSLSASDARGSVYIGDLASAIFMGNLILTPTTVFRRSVIEKIGYFDPGTQEAGEDYHFFAHLCQHGPVALVDVPAAFIRSGGEDHLRANRVQMAASNLMTVRALISLRGGRFALPSSMVRSRLAEAFAWLGVATFDDGRIKDARLPLLQAMRHGSRRARVLAYLALSYLPPKLTRLCRAVWSAKARRSIEAG